MEPIYWIIVTVFAFFVVPTAVGLLVDYIKHRGRRKKYQKTFGEFIDKIFTVVDQNPQQGSILENGLNLGDVFIERGITEYGLNIGDRVQILVYPKFRFFSHVPIFYRKVD